MSNFELRIGTRNDRVFDIQIKPPLKPEALQKLGDISHKYKKTSLHIGSVAESPGSEPYITTVIVVPNRGKSNEHQTVARDIVSLIEESGDTVTFNLDPVRIIGDDSSLLF